MGECWLCDVESWWEDSVCLPAAKLVRARAQKIFIGGRSTRRVLSDEKRYALSNVISKILSGVWFLSDSEAIEGVFLTHYKHFFGTAIPPGPADGVKRLLASMPMSAADDLRLIDGDITLD